ncbi:MAG: PilZ domain-containing protein [Acidimicrobiales bacterium]|jgi:hypothetical protein
MGPPTDISGPLEPGVRVSLEFPQAGTCVGVVASKGPTSVVLDLLDELPDGELVAGLTLQLFMPRAEGLYHWLGALSGPAHGQQVEMELLSSPLFVQRRFGKRVEPELQAEVRRLRSTRRGRPHEMSVADLSRGGMKLEGHFPLSTGDTLEVTVDIGATVQLVGRAVMAYPVSEGTWAAHVTFVDGQRELINLVDDYIASHLRLRSL